MSAGNDSSVEGLGVGWGGEEGYRVLHFFWSLKHQVCKYISVYFVKMLLIASDTMFFMQRFLTAEFFLDYVTI